MAKYKRPHLFVSSIKKAEKIKEILSANYEPGRQDKCKEQVFRNIIQPSMGISRATYYRMLRVPDDARPVIEDPNQLKLFEDEA